jgi:hypothetical protein
VKTSPWNKFEAPQAFLARRQESLSLLPMADQAAMKALAVIQMTSRL